MVVYPKIAGWFFSWKVPPYFFEATPMEPPHGFNPLSPPRRSFSPKDNLDSAEARDDRTGSWSVSSRPASHGSGLPAEPA